MPRLYSLLLLFAFLSAGLNDIDAQSITYSPTNITAGCPVAFTTSITGTQYYWSFGPTASMSTDTVTTGQSDNLYFEKAGQVMVRLAVTTSCCGIVQDSLLITVGASTLPLSITASPDTVCEGTRVVFLSSPANYQVYYFFTDTSLQQQNTSNTFETDLLLTGDSVSVFAYNGTCYTSQVFAYPVVKPIPPSPVLTVSPATDTVCAGEPIVFTASAGYQYYAFYQGSSTQQAGASDTWVTTLGNGNSVRVVGEENGCISLPSNDISVYIKQTPTAGLELSPASACTDTIVTISSFCICDSFYFYVDSVLVRSGTQSTDIIDTLHNNDVVWVVTERNGCYSPRDSVAFVIENCIAGIEAPDARKLQLYPNPVTDLLTVYYTEGMAGNDAPYVVDLTGRRVTVPYIEEKDKFVFNTSQLANGIYFVEVRAMGRSLNEMFVKAGM